MSSTLRMRLWIGEELVVDEEVDYFTAESKALEHGEIARQAQDSGGRWRLLVTDPDGLIPELCLTGP